jgi:four helix bundle protein
MSITVEEADESQYWLEIIEGSNLRYNKSELQRLKTEIEEILSIVSKARKSTSN